MLFVHFSEYLPYETNIHVFYAISSFFPLPSLRNKKSRKVVPGQSRSEKTMLLLSDGKKNYFQYHLPP